MAPCLPERGTRERQNTGKSTKVVLAEICVFSAVVTADYLDEQEQCHHRLRHLCNVRGRTAQTLGNSLGGHIRSGCVRDHAPELVRAKSVKQRRIHWGSPPSMGGDGRKQRHGNRRSREHRSNWNVFQNSFLPRFCWSIASR
jgi:hypothetical protein